MRKDLLELIACPVDHVAPLELRVTVGDKDDVGEGELVCHRCKSRFPISAAIPRLMPGVADDLASVKEREITVRDRGYQHIQAYEMEIERYPELDALRAAVGDCSGSTVLEAGCGVGQVTSAVAAAAHIVGLDFSWQGLMKFAFHGGARVDLLQGDVCRMPLRDGMFDLAVSSQVLEHVPSKALRETFLGDIARTLKPGGRLVITTYNWDTGRRYAGVPKEGLHPNGIFYHCYDAEEFRAELATLYDVEAIWGVQVFLPKTFHLVKRLGRMNVYWDRLWRRRRLSYPHAKLLLAVCRRPKAARSASGSLARRAP